MTSLSALVIGIGVTGAYCWLRMMELHTAAKERGAAVLCAVMAVVTIAGIAAATINAIGK